MAFPQEFTAVPISPAAVLSRPSPHEETQEDREARAKAQRMAAMIERTAAVQRPPPKDLIGYIQRFDNPHQEPHETFGVLHKTNSINDSEIKIFAGFDQIITPQHSEDSYEGNFLIQNADPAERQPHMPKEQWIAARFLSRDVGQSLPDEKLLPIQVVHFSFPLERSRWMLAAILIQNLFKAAGDKQFSKNQLPSFIKALWRLEKSLVSEASSDFGANTSTFGMVSVSWTPNHSDEGSNLQRLTFHGAGLRQSFGLVLDVTDEKYKTLYAGEIEPFAGEMAVALEVFSAAETHVRYRRWGQKEQHRLDILLNRFEDKVENEVKEARAVWESNRAANEGSSGAAAGPSNIARPEASESNKTTKKKNRKEKDRRARRKKEAKENAASDTQQPATEQESQAGLLHFLTTEQTQHSTMAQPATEPEHQADIPHLTTEHVSPSEAQQPAIEQESQAETPYPLTTEQQSQPFNTQSSEPSSSAPVHLIQYDTYQWPCRYQDCRKLTSPYDGSTVICPRCGPYSMIRYCSKKCLFDDLVTHWGVECGRHTLAQKADPLTIEPRQLTIQPAIPSLDHHNRPERHRQMVRHSLDNTADYFIFSDWMQWRDEDFPMDWPANKTASGDVLVPLNFTATGSTVPNKPFFARLLRICFLVGVRRPDMTLFLFRMIRGRLEELGLASEDVKSCLVWQFKHEFNFVPGFAVLLLDQQPVNWPLAAMQIVALEAQYRGLLSGRAGLGKGEGEGEGRSALSKSPIQASKTSNETS